MSSAQRVCVQTGYVLHHYPYRNTSILAEVLTRDYGRIGVVARGARASRSRYFGLMQPFQPLVLSWSGRGDLYTLTAAEADAPPLGLSKRALLSGLYVNELLMRLLHRHDPQEAVYQLYSGVLVRLRDAQTGTEPTDLAVTAEEQALRLFEISLLRELGYGLVLEYDVETGQAIHPDQTYCYQLEVGPVSARRTTPGSVTVSGSTLLALASGEIHAREHLREAKRLMRAVLAPYLGGRPLKSRGLFARMVAHGI